MFERNKISKAKRELIQLINNLKKEDFIFVIGNSTEYIYPNEIAFTKIRKADETKFFEVKVNIPKSDKILFNTPKSIFEISVENYEHFISEFSDCEKAEIKVFYISALLKNGEKLDFIIDKIKLIRYYDHMHRYSSLLDSLENLNRVCSFIAYSIPYISDTKEYTEDFEAPLFESIKKYAERILYEL